ncbi:MAG: sugar kinase, partial [Isosphaeraceae bacterium]|nr:sugar kinase [Isosphaeraceae bacterium]
ERFNPREQAQFNIQHMGGRFDEYEAAHEAYVSARDRLARNLPKGVRAQWIDRSFLPTFTFDESDVVVTLGPDGVVVNTAKYLDGQPLVALNPDPARIDGVLLPFHVPAANEAIRIALSGRRVWRGITMAQATLNDGQTLLAVNDLFLGQKTHVSARYTIRYGHQEERQSSSGIIISTGAGSTGWHRSVLTGASKIMEAFADSEGVRAARDQYRFDWESDYLVFSVREPFISKTSGAEIVYGRIEADAPLEVVSHMPQNGVIFSDGVEEDNLAFNSGAIARIGLAERKLHLVVPPGQAEHGRRNWAESAPCSL